jgi:hypothetical protein
LSAKRTGALVCRVHDNIVRLPPAVRRLLLMLMLYSVLIPWFTLREVAVEVEIVGPPWFLLDSADI